MDPHMISISVFKECLIGCILSSCCVAVLTLMSSILLRAFTLSSNKSLIEIILQIAESFYNESVFL